MPLIVIGIIMEVMLRQIPNVYKFKKNYLDENSDKIEVLFLGNSHSYFGLNPDCMAKRSYNAAHVSQTFDYDLEIIRKYKDGWVNLKFIVLPISYFSLYDKMSESTESWRAKDYCIYYKIRISKYLPHYTEMLSGQLSLKFIRLWSFYVKRIDKISPVLNRVGEHLIKCENHPLIFSQLENMQQKDIGDWMTNILTKCVQSLIQ
jgi:hypothetical protein